MAPRSHHTARCASGSGSGGAGGPAAGFRGLGRCRASTAPPSALSAPIDYFAQPSEDCEELMTKLHNPAALQSSIGLPLTAEEQRSLLLCLQSANLGVDTCLVEGMGVSTAWSETLAGGDWAVCVASVGGGLHLLNALLLPPRRRSACSAAA